MTDEYIALGEFNSEVSSIGETEIQVGRSIALPSPPGETSTEDIMRLVQWLADRLGFRGLKPHHSVAVLPKGLLRGGASGERSVICEDSAVTLAHEIAHWWNGKAFGTAPDATWFGEGVHSYYTYRCLWRSGIWDRDRFSSAMLALESQVHSIEERSGHAYSLGQASTMYWKSVDPWHDVIYRKGPLLGLLLDARIQELTRGGSTLDHLLAVLCKAGSRNVSTADITVALQGALGVNASNVIETFVNRGTVIPSVRDLLTLVAE
jgi:predicted metalloprotease with PDZ domain